MTRLCPPLSKPRSLDTRRIRYVMGGRTRSGRFPDVLDRQVHLRWLQDDCRTGGECANELAMVTTFPLASLFDSGAQALAGERLK
jgi:hypothetical protein